MRPLAKIYPMEWRSVLVDFGTPPSEHLFIRVSVFFVISVGRALENHLRYRTFQRHLRIKEVTGTPLVFCKKDVCECYTKWIVPAVTQVLFSEWF